MFRYGVPIKEGVMHGMRGGGRTIAGGHQIGMPMGNRTGFQNPRFINLGGGQPPANVNLTNTTKLQKLKNLYQNPKFSERGAYEAIKKYGPKAFNWIKGGIGGAFTRFPGMTQLAAYYAAAKPTPVDVKYDITRRENLLPMFGDTKATVEKKIKRNLAEESNPNNPWRYNKYKHGPRKEHPDYDPEKSSYWPWAKGAVEEGGADGTGTKTGTSSRWKDIGTAPELTASQREKLAKDQQNARLKNYLDMMGYDSAKKTAMSDALIDASALVQDATTEAGSLKKADCGNLINRMIQTTSKRLDKPEQIREAVGLMATKAEIEKDIAEGKGGSLKQNAKDLVSAGVYKTETEAMKHLAKKPGFEEIAGALAEKNKGEMTGHALDTAWKVAGLGIPTAKIKGSNKVYKDFKEAKEDAGEGTNIELAFVEEKIDDKKPGDVYIIDDRLIVIQEDGTPNYRW